MLILTRRVGEKLFIGDEITVTVLDVKSNQVQIGISAPLDVAVHREEIYERIQRKTGLTKVSVTPTTLGITYVGLLLRLLTKHYKSSS